MNCGAGLLIDYSSASDVGMHARPAPPSYMITIILTSLAVHIRRINRIGRAGEPEDMIADIVRPCRDQARQAPAVAREQRARGLLELRQVSRHRRHEMIGRIAR